MKKGILAVIASSFLYGIMPVFTKAVLKQGLNSSSTVFFRFLFAAIFAGIFILVNKKSVQITKKQFLQMLLFGGLGFGGTAALLTASYSLIPMGLATMLHFTYPLFVTVVMAFLFSEKLNGIKIISCLMALAGLGCMADFSSGSALGILLAALSGITYACYVIATKKSAFSTLDNLVVVFYVNLFASIIFGLKAVVGKNFMMIPNLKSGLMLLFISLFCTVFALLLLTMGVHILGASTASVLNMLEPITSVFAGIIIYHETLSLPASIGCALVVLSSLITVKGANQKSEVSSIL